VKLQDHPPGIDPRLNDRSPHFKSGDRGLPPGPHAVLAEAELSTSPGWAARLFGWMSVRRSSPQASAGAGAGIGPGAAAHETDAAPQRRKAFSSVRPRSHGEIHEMAKRLITEDRYAFVLLKEAIHQIDGADARAAWDTLRKQMALIPSGTLPVVLCDGSLAAAEVSAFFLDRYAVSNRQFQKFIQAGGYDTLEIWPPEVWPSVVRFTDRTGQPGPRDWAHRTFPPGQGDHPVVGVCWYEAMAYARWVGKRLPSAAEWQKAGGWPDQLSGGDCNRYPWGNLFEPERTNLAAAGVGGTVPVSALPGGDTPNGISQMSGNVWEWLDDPLETVPCESDEMFLPWKPMRRIVGGAYNTYFPSEAACQFITGQGELDRRENIGFRCAVSVDELRPLPEPGRAP
jgi:gamma-glutamyl hercynylcysteine S-oxide synthase